MREDEDEAGDCLEFVVTLHYMVNSRSPSKTLSQNKGRPYGCVGKDAWY